MGGLFVQICLGSGLLFLSLVGIVLSAFLHNLPQVWNFVVRLVRGIFLLSYRFYRILLARLEPFVEEVFGIQSMDNPWRTLLTVCFSILLGCLICLVFLWPLQAWFLGTLALHGCFIGLAWQDFFEPAGLHLGAEE